MSIKRKEEINLFFKERGSTASIEEGYGMTELSSTCTACIGNIMNINSLGIPLNKNIVSIFEPNTDTELDYSNNNIGEICIMGPSMMLGYLNNKEEEDNVIKVHSDGTKWVHSGDLGFIDEDGFVHLVDRIKRMIIRGGFKIYPQEMERVISLVKGVARVCVVSKHSEVYGGEPVAYVIMENGFNGDSIKNDIREICKRELPEYSQPKDIIFKDKFPLTSVGKVDYKTLENE